MIFNIYLNNKVSWKIIGINIFKDYKQISKLVIKCSANILNATIKKNKTKINKKIKYFHYKFIDAYNKNYLIIYI